MVSLKQFQQMAEQLTRLTMVSLKQFQQMAEQLDADYKLQQKQNSSCNERIEALVRTLKKEVSELRAMIISAKTDQQSAPTVVGTRSAEGNSEVGGSDPTRTDPTTKGHVTLTVQTDAHVAHDAEARGSGTGRGNTSTAAQASRVDGTARGEGYSSPPSSSSDDITDTSSPSSSETETDREYADQQRQAVLQQFKVKKRRKAERHRKRQPPSQADTSRLLVNLKSGQVQTLSEQDLRRVVCLLSVRNQNNRSQEAWQPPASSDSDESQSQPQSQAHSSDGSSNRSARRKVTRSGNPQDPIVIEYNTRGVGFLALDPAWRKDWTIPIQLNPSARKMTMEEIQKDRHFLERFRQAQSSKKGILFHRTKLRQVLAGKISPELPEGIRIAIPPPLGTSHRHWDYVTGQIRGKGTLSPKVTETT